MKKVFIITLLLLSSVYSFSQSTIWFYRDILNQEISFMSDLSSFKNIYPIDSGLVIVNRDTINLQKKYKEHYWDFNGFYEGKIKSYYLPLQRNDSLIAILHFCYDKLIQISLYAKGSYNVNNVKYDFGRIFQPKVHVYATITSDSVVNRGTTIITYGERTSSIHWRGKTKKFGYTYDEDFITNESSLVIYDTKAVDLIPSWCGNCNNGNTWAGLKKYLDKKKPD